MDAEKYLIVSVDHNDYSAYIRDRDLNPGSCFQCMTKAEAMDAVERNQRWGIVPTVVYTREWRVASRPKQEAGAA